ncbi:DUF5013 domain-containing protein [Parapedobacter pyrenivorans]|uniref:DUF5013 domain-containing protein n=1 Tax=Parapedobacter pyrenivorans TaxID=1305674 RepID=UPI00333FE0CA
MKMKRNKLAWIGAMVGCLAIGVSACSKSVDAPSGAAKIYMTAATNPVFNVPANPKNYLVDKENGKLVVPVYIGRSGLQEQQSFTLEVRADDAAAQQLISGGVLAANAVVAPADVYSMPTSVSAGKDHSAFDVVFDANKLNSYLGKQLVLTIQLSNPSKFELNENLSKLNVVLDVDPVMLGTKVEVTNQYIKNSGHPFIASVYDGARRGVLADWTTSASVKNYEGGTLGGFDNYGNGGFMSMERYSSPEIPNGKIYQTMTLPAGKYDLDVAFLDFAITEQAYIVVNEGPGLPDADDIAQAIAYTPFTAPSLSFVLTEETEVTLGVVANLLQDQQYFRLDKFRLYHYQNLFN